MESKKKGGLVLSRKAGEKILIGDQIEIEIVRTTGKRAQVWINAPKDVKVLRGELEGE